MRNSGISTASSVSAASAPSAILDILVFAAFSAAWTALALHVTGPTYHLGTSAVGVVALVGAGSMLATPRAGRATDRLGPDAVNLRCLTGVLAAAAVLLLGGVGGVDPSPPAVVA